MNTRHAFIGTGLLIAILLTLLSCRQQSERQYKIASYNVISFIQQHVKNEKDTQKAINVLSNRLQMTPVVENEADYRYLSVYLGHAYAGAENYDSTIKYTGGALQYYEAQPQITDKYPAILIMCYWDMGKSELYAHQNAIKANYYYTKAASLCSQPDIDTFLMPVSRKLDIYNDAANTNRECEQYENAAAFGLQGLNIIRQTGFKDTRLMRLALGQQAIHYSIARQFDSAWKYIGLLEKTISSATDTQGLVLLNMTKAGCYNYVGNSYDSQLKYNLKMIELIDYEHHPQRFLHAFSSCKNILATYIKKKNKIQAQKYNHILEGILKDHGTALDSERITGYKIEQVGYNIWWGSKDSAQLYYWQILDHNQQKYGKDRLKMFAAIESEYNVAIKERKITALNNQNMVFKKQRQSLLIIVGAILLLSIAGFIVARLLFKQRRLKQEKEKILLQQQLLRTQMEPHFIFNTLSTLQGFVKFDEKEKSLKYINQFAKLLRNSLELSRESFVPLNEEIETLESYLSLQQMRFEYAFSYYIGVPEDLDTTAVLLPPMLIQPFVENAIVHGVAGSTEKGSILIRFQQDGQILKVMIADSGKGYSNGPTTTVAHKSLSTTISKERLSILGRENKLPAGVDVQPGQPGTVVTLTIPVKQLHEV